MAEAESRLGFWVVVPPLEKQCTGDSFVKFYNGNRRLFDCTRSFICKSYECSRLALYPTPGRSRADIRGQFEAPPLLASSHWSVVYPEEATGAPVSHGMRHEDGRKRNTRQQKSISV